MDIKDIEAPAAGALLGGGVGLVVGGVGGVILSGLIVAAPPVGALLIGGGLIGGGLIGGGVGGVAGVVVKQKQEEQSQHPTDREKSGQSVINPPHPPVPTSRSQQITNQFLVLVISATQAEFLKSLQAKRQIDMGDGERLYEITKYLCLDSGSDFNKSVEASINQYSVSEGEESEYDIYLVSIELNQSDKGFEPNVNQLDRYDAFRNLADLEINFLSPRLQMEAYGNFEVYSR